MKTNNIKIKKILEKYEEISKLSKISATLGWDLNVNMPIKSAQERGDLMALMSRLTTEKWEDSEFRNLVEKIDTKKLTIEEKAVIRNIKLGGKYYWRVPKSIIMEKAEEEAKSYTAWIEARAKNDFSIFCPHLKKMVEIDKVTVKHYGFRKNPYDALLDMHETGLTTAVCKKIFDNLMPELSKMIKKFCKDKKYEKVVAKYIGKKSYPTHKQKQVAQFVLKKMGYRFDEGNMSISPHPFTTELSRHDVRITNKYKIHDFRDSLMSAMHEGGHALYEQGVSEELGMTPLEGGVSLGIHESQSRFWENMVGRSREFVNYTHPIYQATFGSKLDEMTRDEMYILFNPVKPGMIRIEADEISYNLHIAIRFELEEKLINGKMEVEDLPGEWNKLMFKYLGVKVDKDSNGVLQDVHWSEGIIGYFPTYTLGNLYAAQFLETMKKDIDVEGSIARGEMGTILGWLRDKVHRYGSLYMPKVLCKKVTGKRLSSKSFLKYLKKKYEGIYG